MAKLKTKFVCQNCGASYPKWSGKCENCGHWNTLVEQVEEALGKNAISKSAKTGRILNVQDLNEVVSEKKQERISSGIRDLDIVLGGGILPAGVLLIAGQPGIGKSTLLMQISAFIASSKNVLYVSGEESAEQVALRAKRLGAYKAKNLKFAASTSADDISATIREGGFDLVIIDSIQTISTETVDSSPGSIPQIRECAASLLHFAKNSNVPVILIGHINKEGTLAGPKVLEHIVDTVIQFEGDQHYMYRILRSIKNRFGSTSELGIYEMRGNGLRQVSNPSELLLTQDHEGLSGIAISSAIEGVRPFLVETQALVSSAAYGTPQRSATGFDQRRLNMLLAVLEKRVGFKLMQKDVFLNIAGGLRVTDMAMDLSVISAVLSSNVDTPIENGWCMCGEVGLSGEVRPVSRVEQRIAEAEKLGFEHIIIPAYHLRGITPNRYKIELHPVKKVEEALRILFG